MIGILQGLAGGTLFYITFYEVLDKEKLAKGGMVGIKGVICVFLGFALMAGIQAGTGKRRPFIVRVYML